METISRETYLKMMQKELKHRKDLSRSEAKAASLRRLTAAGLLTRNGTPKKNICSK